MDSSMPKPIRVICFAILMFFLEFGICSATEPLPELQLTIPESKSYREYLGLKGAVGETFFLREIQADILLIELFSMYCPYCQKEAPIINELYEKLEKISKKGPIVKIIGLGASNSVLEVQQFKDSYDIVFPLFPDKDMTMYKALKGEATPGFISASFKDVDMPVIVLRNSGGFYSVDDFLAELIEKSGF